MIFLPFVLYKGKNPKKIYISREVQTEISEERKKLEFICMDIEQGQRFYLNMDEVVPKIIDIIKSTIFQPSPDVQYEGICFFPDPDKIDNDTVINTDPKLEIKRYSLLKEEVIHLEKKIYHLLPPNSLLNIVFHSKNL